MTDVFVRGKLTRIWESGEVDVQFEYPEGWDAPISATFRAQDVVNACEEWICEQHPHLHWPHDDCAGPGMPCLHSTMIRLELP